MKMAYHFVNGETLVHEDFVGVTPGQTANEMFEALEELKRRNSPMKINDSNTGEQIVREAKNLKSIEFILE